MQQMYENKNRHIYPWIHVSKYIQKYTTNHTFVDTKGWFAPRTQDFSSMLQFSICLCQKETAKVNSLNCFH